MLFLVNARWGLLGWYLVNRFLQADAQILPHTPSRARAVGAALLTPIRGNVSHKAFAWVLR